MTTEKSNILYNKIYDEFVLWSPNDTDIVTMSNLDFSQNTFQTDTLRETSKLDNLIILNDGKYFYTTKSGFTVTYDKTIDSKSVHNISISGSFAEDGNGNIWFKSGAFNPDGVKF